MALTGIIASLRSSNLTREFLLSSSLILLALTLPFNSGNFLWRFDLMMAVLAPLILGIVIGKIEDPRLSGAIALLILEMLTPLTLSQAYAIRPSIPPEEYKEPKELVHNLKGRYTLVVPSVKLLYWVQTIDLGAVRSP